MLAEEKEVFLENPPEIKHVLFVEKQDIMLEIAGKTEV